MAFEDEIGLPGKKLNFEHWTDFVPPETLPLSNVICTGDFNKQIGMYENGCASTGYNPMEMYYKGLNRKLYAFCKRKIFCSDCQLMIVMNVPSLLIRKDPLRTTDEERQVLVRVSHSQTNQHRFK